ncbi:hypothetical protein PLICRDRAFT_180384 [Plicaturopsis crispa FD-325 SS-3]|uniref:Uncharacterized protein n=1 Tax=Plicaturopsis crispa FD-325 SS-3 TaxID=944288 RepID=A0A0C9SW39_PLICR|nr:hypothetical protein PLICRDRAFT_180384 [Plicaturopsis crispa FD-325 SS-3]
MGGGGLFFLFCTLLTTRFGARERLRASPVPSPHIPPTSRHKPATSATPKLVRCQRIASAHPRPRLRAGYHLPLRYRHPHRRLPSAVERCTALGSATTRHVVTTPRRPAESAVHQPGEPPQRAVAGRRCHHRERVSRRATAPERASTDRPRRSTRPAQLWHCRPPARPPPPPPSRAERRHPSVPARAAEPPPALARCRDANGRATRRVAQRNTGGAL